VILASNPGRVFTRDILLEKVWGFKDVALRETRTVDVHIRYLRQKIERDPANPEYIETLRGVGYRFKNHH
jgi:DNA-binding response OmpR family regulator